MKNILSLAFCFLIDIILVAQAPEIEWQNDIGGISSDGCRIIISLEDGNLLAAGYSRSGAGYDKTEANIGDYDFWVLKLDSLGNIIWQNTIGGSDYDYLTTAIHTTDGGYLIGGNSESGISGDKTQDNFGDKDYWILKLDSAGNIIWQNTIGSANADVLNCLVETTDGGFLAGGYSPSGISGNKTIAGYGSTDYWLIKITSDGSVDWQKAYGGSYADELYSIIETTEHNYLLGGNSYSGISGNKNELNIGLGDYWLLEVNPSGDIIWQNTIGGTSSDYFRNITTGCDEGYIISGSSKSGISGDKSEEAIGDKDYWILKIDTSGCILWQNTIGGAEADELYNVQCKYPSGYIIAGYSSSDISSDKTENNYDPYFDYDIGWDYWMVKIDSAGNVLTDNTIGGTGEDKLYGLCILEDGGIVLGGESTTSISVDKTESNSGIYDFWIVKISSSYELCNGIDDDGDGLIDDLDPDIAGQTMWYADTDGDTFGNADEIISACYIASGLVSDSTDCDDTNADIFPNSFEITNSLDDDCNGQVDEYYPTIEWQNTIGGSDADWLAVMKQTSDGGFIAGGSSLSGISGDKNEGFIGGSGLDFDAGGDYWILKLNEIGEIVWQKTIGGSEDDILRDIIEVKDGGYIIGGSSKSDISGNKTAPNLGFYDFWIIKLDSAGNIQWQKTFGGANLDLLFQTEATNDGGYILGGNKSSSVTEADYYIVKLDSLGNTMWQKTIAGDHNDYLHSIRQTSDNGYILGGFSGSHSGLDKIENSYGEDYWIIKLDSLGNIQWQNTIGGYGEDECKDVLQTPDGGYLVGGESSSSYTIDKTEGNFSSEPYMADYWILKLDSSGEIIWQKTIGGDGADRLFSMDQTQDGEFILCGYSDSDISDNKTVYEYGNGDLWIVKIDSTGNILWQDVFGGSSFEELHTAIIQETEEGGYIMGGTSQSDISGNKTEDNLSEDLITSDFWIIKLNPDCISTFFFLDADGDGYGDADSTIFTCYAPGGYVSDFTDCNDNNSEIKPGSAEFCNLIDDNCNGDIDDDVIYSTWYLDADGDTFGNSIVDSVSCLFSVTGYVSDNTDCDDTNADISPAIAEICNLIDDNCNSEIDEGMLLNIFYYDHDGDSFGDITIDSASCLTEIFSYVPDNTDCNDTSAAINPFAIEVCNSIDDNCNSETDEGLMINIFYLDSDGDNFGDALMDTSTCFTEISGYIPDSTDCDDSNASIYPGATEIPDNGIDEDCDGEDLITSILYANFTGTVFIHPNPTNAQLFIEANGFNTNVTVKIYNTRGEEVKSFECTFALMQTDVSEFSTGMYVIIVSNGERTVIEKFVKE